MTLLECIADLGRRSALADACKTSPDYLWQVATGRRKASFKLAREIEAATSGLISRHDIRPDIFGPAPAANDSGEEAA